MSFTAVAWAMRLKLPTHEKFVLVALANYADDKTFECYPGFGAIAEITSLSRDSVIRAIKALEAAGLVTVQKRRNGRVNQSNVYRLKVQVKGKGVVADSDYPPVADSDQWSPTATRVVADSNPNLSHEPVIQKKEKEHAREKVELLEANGIFTITVPAALRDQFLKAYPGIDLDAEILKAQTWLTTNPDRRPAPERVAGFLNNWMTRAKDKNSTLARTTPTPKTAGSKSRKQAARERMTDWLFGDLQEKTETPDVIDIQAVEIHPFNEPPHSTAA